MSKLRLLYLGLALLGAVWPMAHILTYLGGEGASLGGLVVAWTDGAAVRGLAADLLVTGGVLTLWIVAETSVRRNWSALIAIPATLCLGVSCGLPLYLFLRTRPV